jgi:8-oxo-dGTP pyrophosphatase MutT (NUDIX family)
MKKRVRVQVIVLRDDRILMARVQQDGLSWWCLPGGGQEEGETPAEGALRELWEECNVRGQIVRQTSHAFFSLEDETITFLVDIGEQEPWLGIDPEAVEMGWPQALVDISWLHLSEIPERDRAFLWSAGLLGVERYYTEVESWGDDPSYPGR